MTLSYVLKKLLYALSVLWGVITLVFILFNALPGDPARLTLGQRSDVASIENVRKELNLDKPLLVRYGYYLNDLLPLTVHTTDSVNQAKYQYRSILSLGSDNALVMKKPYFGRSYQTKRLVWDVLADALPGTIVLAISAIIFATVFGILLGILAALKKDTFWDVSAIVTSVMGISAPSFFAGLIIAYVFGYLLSDLTGLPMVGSLWEYDAFGGRRLAIQHLILPALTLGIRPLAIIAQLTRSAMLDVLSQDYVRTAYAKGLSRFKVVFKHALPNALNPVVTAISGWMAELLAGSFFVEFIFSWKGLGKLTVDSLDKFDFPVVMGAVLLSATIFVCVSVLTDILYAKLDPRVKLN
ncbi:ABC transporter permease [Taibaiella sp. KBW10]|uniref:ABC transporter permease n=1 Tax=Taibaiella sp. KBW10 TaxID=2153357 RepID=UPI000F5B83D6|nr:ABC transporter permease [Taibaiella sp. KBW10]RQO30815.1 ABC transporter permease [Taibaiella sp. KBW10]